MTEERTIHTSRHETKVMVVSVHDWPPVDLNYNHVLLRLPDGDVRLSCADAQRLGHWLNNAAGGVLPATLPLGQEES